MYSEIHVDGFRGLNTVSLRGLRRINLLVGRNNSGKTSILEAVHLISNATAPLAAVAIAQLRGQRFAGSSGDDVWRTFFDSLAVDFRIDAFAVGEVDSRVLGVSPLRSHTYTTNTASLAENLSKSEVSGLTFRYRSANGDGFTTSVAYGPEPGRITAPPQERADIIRSEVLPARGAWNPQRDAEQYGQLVKLNRQEVVLEALRLLEPRLRRIEVLPDPAGPTIYVDLGLESLLPLAVCGDGLVRLFSIVVQMVGVRDGVLLIDEIDSGLHHSVIDSLWDRLAELAERFNVQVIATTHSGEMVRSAMLRLGGTEAGLGLFRIERRDEGHRIIEYDREAISGALSVGFEVR